MPIASRQQAARQEARANPDSAAVHLFHAHGPQPRRSSSAGDRTRLQDGPFEIRIYRERVDPQVRHLAGGIKQRGWGDCVDCWSMKQVIGVGPGNEHGRSRAFLLTNEPC